ncbi:DNA-binding protein [Neisseria gonorrhoeae]|uniref:DNA-binding protein n=1 Tax=Neisseria gonorrhoeae TaxID=485 RepID=A0A378VXE6_NEIGO|nr:DNA-binding protein [Neisseria gonorrhoeae]
MRQQSQLPPRRALPDARPLGEFKQTINDYLGSVTLQSIIEQKNNGDGSRVVQFTHIH